MNERDETRTYAVTCLYGLESILAGEVRELLGAEAEHHWCEVVFPFAGPPARLRELRVGGNVFLLMDRFPIGHTVPDLKALEEHLRAVPLGAWERCHAELAGEATHASAVSISVTRKGEHNYSYMDVEELALKALGESTGRRTTLEPRPLELRIEIHGEWCRLLGRLTPAPLSQRAYMRYRGPFETEPTLAAAMVRLSEPGPADLFLDPFCGVGTVPIERARAGRAGAILAGDDKVKRVAWAEGNARSAGVLVHVACWDALALPFADRSFTHVVSGPPQSDPSTGRPWQLGDFARLVHESLRVLRHGGRMVWLMQHGRLLRQALKRAGEGTRQRQMRCDWKGAHWSIHTIEKPL
ncbi:MAG: methyltransferase domain-containing protein [Planctomycetota bacterium]